MNPSVENEAGPAVESTGPAAPSPSESFRLAGAAFTEFRTYLGHYFAAKSAMAKLTLRRVAILAGVVAVGFLVVGAMLVSATVLLLIGAADALGSAFTPPKPWIGDITIGLVFIGGTILWTYLVLRKLTGVSRRKTIEEFERRRREEKQKFGRDIVDRATSSVF